MLKDGLIEESSSECSSPIAVVKKKDGSIQTCVHYWKLNTVTKFDAYPMPQVDEMLDQVSNAIYFFDFRPRKRMLSGANDKRGSRKDGVQQSSKTVSIHNDAIWSKWSSSHVPKDDMHMYM